MSYPDATHPRNMNQAYCSTSRDENGPQAYTTNGKETPRHPWSSCRQAGTWRKIVWRFGAGRALDISKHLQAQMERSLPVAKQHGNVCRKKVCVCVRVCRRISSSNSLSTSTIGTWLRHSQTPVEVHRGEKGGICMIAVASLGAVPQSGRTPLFSKHY